MCQEVPEHCGMSRAQHGTFVLVLYALVVRFPLSGIWRFDVIVGFQVQPVLLVSAISSSCSTVGHRMHFARVRLDFGVFYSAECTFEFVSFAALLRSVVLLRFSRYEQSSYR